MLQKQSLKLHNFQTKKSESTQTSFGIEVYFIGPLLLKKHITPFMLDVELLKKLKGALFFPMCSREWCGVFISKAAADNLRSRGVAEMLKV